MSQSPDGPTFYERMGGAPVFEQIVAEFYRGVANDPVLRALYPETDLGPAERRLRMFLEQYWGGPTTYQQERGHPRLRMRHLPLLSIRFLSLPLAAPHGRRGRRRRPRARAAGSLARLPRAGGILDGERRR